jgi:hypothetical protein
MKMAREARLALREIRINADKTRKVLKEDSLRYAKAIQGIYNIIEESISPLEKYLEKQEKFAEIQERNRKEELKRERLAQLEPYREHFSPALVDLAEISDEMFSTILESAKVVCQNAEEAKRKAEQERIAKEKAEQLEREKVKLENEKLKAEAEKREREIAKAKAKAELERKAIEEKAKKEKAELEAKIKQETEERRKLEAQLKEKENISIPKPVDNRRLSDKTILKELVKKIDNFELPKTKSEEATIIVGQVKTLLNKISVFLKDKTDNL